MNIILVFFGSGLTLALGLWVGVMIESHPEPTIVVALIIAVLSGIAFFLARKINHRAKAAAPVQPASD